MVECPNLRCGVTVRWGGSHECWIPKPPVRKVPRSGLERGAVSAKARELGCSWHKAQRILKEEQR